MTTRSLQRAALPGLISATCGWKATVGDGFDSRCWRIFGPCDILANGAGGNSAKANTDKEFYEAWMWTTPLLQTFFTISPENVSSC